MNIHPSFLKTFLAALLLAGCGYTIAEPDTDSVAAQNTAESRVIVPAEPISRPVDEPTTADIDAEFDVAGAEDTIDPGMLHGQWTVKEQHPDAGEVVTLFSINSDNSFAGTMTVSGKVVWSYSGNWYLDGNLITWFYTQSTPPLMLADETEVDEIISVDSEKLVYRSGKRDVEETLYRAR